MLKGIIAPLAFDVSEKIEQVVDFESTRYGCTYLEAMYKTKQDPFHSRIELEAKRKGIEGI